MCQATCEIPRQRVVPFGLNSRIDTEDGVPVTSFREGEGDVTNFAERVAMILKARTSVPDSLAHMH